MRACTHARTLLLLTAAVCDVHTRRSGEEVPLEAVDGVGERPTPDVCTAVQRVIVVAPWSARPRPGLPH
eukprot:6727148-Alexandrium_andersonii.AAC.1